MMAADDPRARLLGRAGFTYDERLDVWTDRSGGRVLRGETVRTSSDEWVANWIAGGAASETA